ncbi:MAG TPA: hypothetical protein PKA53_10940 [Sphingobacterium sp.]|nr:hypothetical protein [Sphingobacterium sp.]
MLPHIHRPQEPQCANTEPSRSLQQPKQLSNALRNEFKSLVATWEEETLFTSSLTEIVLNHAYQRIIGMGNQALPYILEALEAEPNHWSWALKAITGENPVSPEKQGDIYAEREFWLGWMKENLGR